MSDIQPAKVREYWGKAADAFDRIYSGNKHPFMRRLDRVFRWDMYERYRMTIEQCEDPRIRSVLDIGAGSGRFSVRLAEMGKKVVGIDFSKGMVDAARKLAADSGVADKCDFQAADFMEWQSGKTFDATIAIGVFDYVRNPEPFLRKMRDAAGIRVIASFPIFWTWRIVPRWIRLTLAGCPVYFYRSFAVRSLFMKAGLRIERLERIGKIFFVVARPEGFGESNA